MREFIILAFICGLAVASSVPETAKTLKKGPNNERIFGTGSHNADFSSISLASPFDLFSGFNLSDIGFDLFSGLSGDDGTYSTPTVPIASALAAVGGSLAGIFGIFVFPLQIASQILAIIAIAMFIAVYSKNNDEGYDYALSPDSYSESYDSLVNSYAESDWANTARSLVSSPLIHRVSNLVFKGLEKYAEMQREERAQQ